MIYWFYLIKCKNNFIKALFKNKNGSVILKSKRYFFNIVLCSLTNIIENKIKEKDKANIYSYRKKDVLDA